VALRVCGGLITNIPLVDFHVRALANGQGGVQPGALGLLAQGAQAPGQVMRLGSGNHRVPHQVAARGKALDALLNAGAHAVVIALDLVARVDQHQRAARPAGARGRWQHRAQSFEAVFARHRDRAASLKLGHVARQGLAVGRVQFEQLEPVARGLAHQAVHHEGRTGVNAQRARGVEVGHQVKVVVDGRGRFGRLPFGGAHGGHELDDAVLRLAALLGVVAVQPVQTGPGVGVDQVDAGLFEHEVAQRGHQRDVLEHIGVIAGMKGVAVTEHPGMVAPEFAGRATISYNGGLRSEFCWPRGEAFTPPKRVPSEDHRPWKRAAKPS